MVGTCEEDLTVSERCSDAGAGGTPDAMDE